MCGPASLRCARCRGVRYCGPKCQREAWGAHKSACAAAVAAGRHPGALALIAEQARTNRKLVEFQEAVVAAGGIPLIVRALGAADVDAAEC